MRQSMAIKARVLMVISSLFSCEWGAKQHISLPNNARFPQKLPNPNVAIKARVLKEIFLCPQTIQQDQKKSICNETERKSQGYFHKDFGRDAMGQGALKP
jgi:hypothetical protein